MKLNKKGFTLIELLAVVIVLGLVMVIVFPSSIDVFKNTKLKSEEEFLDRLSQSIDSYIELNTGNIDFGEEDVGCFIKKQGSTITSKTRVKKATITINDVIDEGIISESDFINPNNKETSCKRLYEGETTENVKIYVYRDSDFVYCHKVKIEDLPCLTTDYKNKLNTDYAIDTCIWELEELK